MRIVEQFVAFSAKMVSYTVLINIIGHVISAVDLLLPFIIVHLADSIGVYQYKIIGGKIVITEHEFLVLLIFTGIILPYFIRQSAGLVILFHNSIGFTVFQIHASAVDTLREK